MKNRFSLILFLLLSGSLNGQNLFVFEQAGSDTLNHESVRNLYPFTRNIQTAPVIKSDMEWSKWICKKVFQEKFVIIERPGYLITADPLFDAELGRETEAGQNTWVNTRGVQAYGRVLLGKQGEDYDMEGNSSNKATRSFEFYSNYFEAQTRAPRFLDSLSSMSGGMPGQGFILKPDGIWDHGYATGWARFNANKYFTFELGTGKNFLGNGYRSMLLSDNARNYPYFRIDTRIWRFHYTNLWAEFQDNNYHDGLKGAYQKKYGVFHYLSYSVTKRLEVSLFEAIIWQGRDSTHSRGFEFAYLNPVIFLRPVEWSLGSPDNALMGMNLNYRFDQGTSLYGQFLIDEFNVSEMKAGNGFWANKYAGQIGAKTFIPIGNLSNPTDGGIQEKRGIFLQSEFNFARPFTYAHWTSKQNYGHLGQPLAHPLGGNFYESVSFARFHWGRLITEARYSWARFGSNIDGLNYGHDIFLSYDSPASQYGNYIGQGYDNRLTYKTITCSYLLNPSSLLNVFVSLTDRHQVTDDSDSHSLWVTFGVRNSIRNKYFDF